MLMDTENPSLMQTLPALIWARQHRGRNPVTLGIVLFAVLCSLFILIGALLVRFESAQYQQQQLEYVQQQLDTLSTSLQNRIYSNIYRVASVETAVAMNPELTQDDFARAMAGLFQDQQDLRNIGLAREMVIQMMYPIEGNEAAIGLDYTTLPEQFAAVNLALQLNQIVLAGPLNLVQGGQGIIARIPIHTLDSTSQQKTFWGFASVVMNSEALFTGAGITEDHESLLIAIRGRDGTGAQGEVFFGDPSVFDRDPITQSIELPYGSWQMGGIPAAGWTAYSALTAPLMWIYLAVALIILTFAAISVLLLIEYTQAVESLKKERNLFAEGPVFTMEWAPEQHGNWPVTSVSSNVATILGYKPADMLHPEFVYTDLVHPDDRERIINTLNYNIEHRIDRYEESYRFRTKTGDYLWVYDFTLLVRDPAGHLTSIRSYMYDQSARKQTEEALRIAQERLEKTAYDLTENIPVGTYTMVQPAEGGIARFAFMSRRFLELTGLDREEAASDTLKAFAHVHPDDFDAWVALNARAFEEKQPFFGETRVLVNGDIRWLAAESSPRTLPDGTTVWEGVLTDITERKRDEATLQATNAALEQEIEERRFIEEQLKIKTDMLEILSMQDGLTHIANRRQFDERANLEWKQTLRTGLPLALVMMDIDHFKPYNDYYGHGAGDECLRQVAQVLKHCCDRPLDLVARYGGEEFVALLPETDQDGARHLAEHMLRAVEQLAIPHACSSAAKIVTLSVGVAIHSPDRVKTNLQDLQHCADQALYEAKRQGRNRVVEY